MNFIKKMADNKANNSWANKKRKLRMEFFQSLVHNISKKDISILDVGGTEIFWEMMNFIDKDITITLLNLNKLETKYNNFNSVKGDARSMPEFASDSFDIVFSNSVIEHVGNYHDQLNMAKEVQRIGKRYFIQTPNYFFPIEPHFLFPGFQFLHQDIKVYLIRNFNMGWYKKTTNKLRAMEIANGTNLLTKNKLLHLFPGSEIYTEKIFLLNKSFIVYKGF